MKITAKLAYSQIKINKSRTRWTLIAIALSTALTTAVACFVASGNALLVDLLGEDYGEYGQSYQVMLLIPAIIFVFLIVAMSVTVISNVFRISAQERVNQFGVLKCTGATVKQIKDTVMYESAWLCKVGIPIGIVLGIFFAYFGIQIANYFLGNLNSMSQIMMQSIDLTMHFVISLKALVFAALFSFLTVLYAAWRPAHKTARVPAIECIRGTDEIQVDKKHFKESRLVKKIFGFEGTLADRNLKRNHHNFRATVISLSVGVILFVSLGGLATQAKGIQNFMNFDLDENVMAEYMSDYTRNVDPVTNRETKTYLHPIQSTQGNALIEDLQQYKDVEIWGSGSDNDTYHTVLSSDLVTQDMKEQYENSSDNSKDGYEYNVEIIALDEKHYAELCKLADVPLGSNILLNDYSFNDFGHEVHLQPFDSSMSEISLIKADGTSTDLPVQGSLTLDKFPKELIYPYPNPVRIVLPQALVRGYSWYCRCDTKDEEGFIAYANEVLKSEYPGGSNENAYMEKGFNTRVYRMDDYIKVMNMAITMVAIFMYSFVALLMLIGLTNVISTLSTNVIMRSKEFAVLKSVGMTPESLKKMLDYESILCSLKALIIGVPIGLIVTVLINLPIRSMYPIPYSIPWLSTLLCICVVFLITLGTTKYAANKLKNQNIIESIRSAQ